MNKHIKNGRGTNEIPLHMVPGYKYKYTIWCCVYGDDWCVWILFVENSQWLWQYGREVLFFHATTSLCHLLCVGRTNHHDIVIPSKIFLFRQGSQRKVIFRIGTAGDVQIPFDLLAKCSLQFVDRLQCKLWVYLSDFAVPRTVGAMSRTTGQGAMRGGRER